MAHSALQYHMDYIMYRITILNLMNTNEMLIEETEKIRKKLAEKLPHIQPENSLGREFLKNIHAYVKDSEYFQKEDDLVRAFECVVWAWAWLEIGLMIEILKERE